VSSTYRLSPVASLVSVSCRPPDDAILSQVPCEQREGFQRVAKVPKMDGFPFCDRSVSSNGGESVKNSDVRFFARALIGFFQRLIGSGLVRIGQAKTKTY
jgi:hypothetical protein